MDDDFTYTPNPQKGNIDSITNQVVRAASELEKDIHKQKTIRQTAQGRVYPWNEPVAIAPEMLVSVLTSINTINNEIKNNPELAKALKKPTAHRQLVDNLQKITSMLSSIDYSLYPDFKKNFTNEINQFNNLIFSSPNVELPSFQYPEHSDPYHGSLEGQAAAGAKATISGIKDRIKNAVRATAAGEPY